MGLTLTIIAICLAFGGVAGVSALKPTLFADIRDQLRGVETLKRFSPRNTLFIIGPTANHPACRMQRRLLKPAIPALIAEDVCIIELYGGETPRKNGEDIDWLDPALLRHALDADRGFFIIYVDHDGKTRFRSEAPMVTADLLVRANLRIDHAPTRLRGGRSKILKRLRAA